MTYTTYDFIAVFPLSDGSEVNLVQNTRHRDQYGVTVNDRTGWCESAEMGMPEAEARKLYRAITDCELLTATN